MGVQLGIPILLCLLFQVNVLVLLICFAAFVLHEIVAHYDVHYSAPKRRIRIWEVHVHNYMATIPLYLLMLIMVLNWDVVLKLVQLQWAGQFTLQRLPAPQGGVRLPARLPAVHVVLCVVPYSKRTCVACGRAARTGLSVYVTSTGSFLPGPPIDNDQIEDILGLIDGRRSRLKSRILKANGIRTRHYAMDREHRTTHTQCRAWPWPPRAIACRLARADAVTAAC